MQKPLGPSSRLERCFGRCMLWILPIPGGRGLVTGNGCLPHSARDQSLSQRRAMGSFIFCHCRHQFDHCRHRGEFGSMGGSRCLPNLGCRSPLCIPHLVDRTRTQIRHQKAVKPVNSRKSAPKPPQFLMLINNLHGFIHEMTASPCQR